MGGYYACDDCCHMRDLDEYGDAEYRALVEVANLLHTRNLNPNPNCLEVRRMVRSVDPYHLMFGTIACGEPWYWSEEGAGLGMDVMMKAGQPVGFRARVRSRANDEGWPSQPEPQICREHRSPG